MFARLIGDIQITGRLSTYLHELMATACEVGVGDELVRHKFIQAIPLWNNASRSGCQKCFHKWAGYIHHHHHHVALVARISLTLSRLSSLSFIALGRSSGQHPVSSHSCWMYVRAGRPAFARPCVGVHKSTSLMSSSLLLQQCPACLVRLPLNTKRHTRTTV